jgi:hypothetical protein
MHQTSTDEEIDECGIHIWSALSCFLGTIAKFWKVTISVIMSVHPRELGSYWMDFHEILCMGIYLKSVKKIQLIKVWQQ